MIQRLGETQFIVIQVGNYLPNCLEINSCIVIVNVISILGHEGKIAPKKGAAAFWYDILSAGFRDLHSVHAGCPVLKGSKWILNKWLFMLDNFKKFPCKLSQLTRFSPPSKEHYF